VRRGRKGKGRAGKDGDRAAGEGDGRGMVWYTRV